MKSLPDRRPGEPKPLSDAEEARLGAMLALIQDDPHQKITVTARILCAFVSAKVAGAEAAHAAAVEKMAALLREAEWGGRHDTDDHTCGFCRSYEREGHADDCELGALLARLEGGE